MKLDIWIALIALQLVVDLGIALLLLRVKAVHKLLDVGHAVPGAVVLPRGHRMVVDIHGADMQSMTLRKKKAV